MTERELAAFLTRNFYEDFVSVTACLVVQDGCVDTLYNLATGRGERSGCDSEFVTIGSDRVGDGLNIGAVGVESDLAASCRMQTGSMTKPQRDKLLFRAAYTLEIIYFEHHELFEKFTEHFCDDFANCTNSSAKRHFGKMMAHLLLSYTPQQSQSYAIAEAAAGWILEPKVRVAVQIHAMEILFLLRGQVDWIPELLEEIIETLSRDTSPAITVRLRRWRDL